MRTFTGFDQKLAGGGC